MHPNPEQQTKIGHTPMISYNWQIEIITNPTALRNDCQWNKPNRFAFAIHRIVQIDTHCYACRSQMSWCHDALQLRPMRHRFRSRMCSTFNGARMNVNAAIAFDKRTTLNVENHVKKRAYIFPCIAQATTMSVSQLGKQRETQHTHMRRANMRARAVNFQCLSAVKRQFSVWIK